MIHIFIYFQIIFCCCSSFYSSFYRWFSIKTIKIYLRFCISFHIFLLLWCKETYVMEKGNNGSTAGLVLSWFVVYINLKLFFEPPAIDLREERGIAKLSFSFSLNFCFIIFLFWNCKFFYFIYLFIFLFYFFDLKAEIQFFYLIFGKYLKFI